MKIKFATALMLSMSSTQVFADWTDNWFDNAVVDKPSSYQSQSRNFYSLGGMRARVQTSNDYLATVSLPKLKAGCGGIDVFMGGISFLDEDYLVEKFQNMIQAAPAVAFNMALGVMSEKLEDQVTKLESATNWLNQIQLNDCAMTKTVIAEFKKDDPEVMGAVWNEMTQTKSVNTATTRGYQEQKEKTLANNNNPTVDLTDAVEDCPAEFKALVADGSMIHNATELAGMEAYADIVRGLLGDIEISTPENSNIPIVREIVACPAVDQMTVEDMVYGSTLARRSVEDGGDCYIDADKSVLTITRERLSGIASRISTGAALLPADIQFIENHPYVPTLPIIKQAIVTGNVEMEIESLTNIIATAIAYRVFNDLYRNTTTFMNSALAASTPMGSTAAANTRCDTKLFAHALDKFARVNKRLKQYSVMAHTTYATMRIEQQSNFNFAAIKKQERDTNRRNNAAETVK